MTEQQPVRFTPGMPIDTSRPLLVAGLFSWSTAWGTIVESYPEIRAAGPNTNFLGAHQLVIQPPHVVETRMLQTVRRMCGRDRSLVVHVEETGGNISSIMVIDSRSDPRGEIFHVDIYRCKS